MMCPPIYLRRCGPEGIRSARANIHCAIGAGRIRKAYCVIQRRHGATRSRRAPYALAAVRRLPPGQRTAHRRSMGRRDGSQRVHMAPIRIRGGRHESFQTPRAMALARPRGRQRPDQSPRPLGQGIAVAGAMTAGAAGTLTGAAAEPLKDEPWSLEFGSVLPAAADAVAVREGRRAHAQQSQRRVPQLACAHAAPSAQRHDHAEQPALLDQPLRRARHRSGRAQARHPRHGAPAARIHARDAVALSAGDAHGVRRMRRQFGADVFQRAAAGHGAGDPRPGVELRMDRRAALGAARRGRHRPQRQMAGRRGRRCAVPRSQRAGEEGL